MKRERARNHKVKSASWEEVMEPKPPAEIEFDFKTSPRTRELEEQIRAAHRAAHANIPTNTADKSATGPAAGAPVPGAWLCSLGILGFCVDKAGNPVTESIPSDANSCPRCGLPRSVDPSRLNARDTAGLMRDPSPILSLITPFISNLTPSNLVIEYLKLVNFGLGDCVDVPDRAGNVARAVVLQTLKLERTLQNEEPWDWLKGDSGVNVPKGQEINVALIRFPGWSSDQDEIIQVEALRPSTDLPFETFGDSISIFRRRPSWQNDDRWAAPMEFAYWLRWSAPTHRSYIDVGRSNFVSDALTGILGPSNFLRDVLTGKRFVHRLCKITSFFLGDIDVMSVVLGYHSFMPQEERQARAPRPLIEQKSSSTSQPHDPPIKTLANTSSKRKLELSISDGDSKTSAPISNSKDSHSLTGSSKANVADSTTEDDAAHVVAEDDAAQIGDNVPGSSEPLLQERIRLTNNRNFARLHACIIKMSLDGKQCADCGVQDVCLLENDHSVPGEKILKQNGSGRKVGSLIHVPLQVKGKELRKCEPTCLRCHRVRTTEGYNPERHVAPSVKEKRACVDAEKTKVPCLICGFSDTKRPYLFDNDHLDPAQKVNTVAQMVTGNADLETVLKEMAKCRRICCNCHRKHTSTTWRRLEDFTNEEKELARIYLFGTPEQILLLGRKRPVVQVRPQTGEVVAIFPSLQEAADDPKVAGYAWEIGRYMDDPQPKPYRNSLWLVPTFQQLKLIADGKGIWRNPHLTPAEEGPPRRIIREQRRKPVAQVDEVTGVLLGVYPSQSIAAEEVEGSHRTIIARCMNGRQTSHIKCLWRRPTADELKLLVGGKSWRLKSAGRAPPGTKSK